MNPLNHFLFALNMVLIFLDSSVSLFFIVLFCLLFGNLVDLDHLLNKKAPWYHKRTWIQEPFGFLVIGFPIAIALSFLNKSFFLLVLIPYASHLILDYFCIHEAYPLAPFSKLKKREGFGIFRADFPFIRMDYSKSWKRRIESIHHVTVSENYFLIFNLCLLFFLIVF